MQKKYFWLLISAIIIVAASATIFVVKKNSEQNSPNSNKSQMMVVSTFYPLAYFAKAVGGEHVKVVTITPAGAEPHEYEPTPQDIINAYNAKVFVMNGGGIDVWAEKTKSDLQTKGAYVVDMSESIRLMTAPAELETQEDPHIWLDPVLEQQGVELIRDAFLKVDPSNADSYSKNADVALAQLRDLDGTYKTGLVSCKLRSIVTSHAALGYLAKRYGLEQIPIAGLSPDAEPSARKLAEISQLAKQKDIRYIFFETLVSPKLSQTIAQEVGAQTLVFNPLEGLTDDEVKSGKTYFSEMLGNLENLRISLQCE